MRWSCHRCLKIVLCLGRLCWWWVVVGMLAVQYIGSQYPLQIILKRVLHS
uniref:Uncharacterized protein n=1 Tax=Phakopsora pachyrhizi TaxID=170000 RepID=A0A0S1MIE2_PHAPC